MDMLPTQKRNDKRRGQTLLEFALTLPIVLTLVFGMVEGSRLFQSWVTIQNAARSAARYASTGRINWDIYEIEDRDTYETQAELETAILDAFVPCVTLEDERGTQEDDDGVATYTGGTESLFATWYSGLNCEPTDEEHQQLRKDLLRLMSVMNEARQGAGVLSLDSDTLTQVSPAQMEYMLKRIWNDPVEGQNYARFFNVTICSSRANMFEESDGYTSFANRFVFVRNQVDAVPDGALPPGETPVVYSSYPYCMLNENPTTDPLLLQNGGRRWLDAGGPGDRVTISVQYNHPLITPLESNAIASDGFIAMESRRSTVNESFRAPRAIGNAQRSLPAGGEETPVGSESLTPSETPPPTDAPSTTPTSTFTPTPTEKPFLCEYISVEFADPPFNGNQIYVVFVNENTESVTLTNVFLEWEAIEEFPNMYLRAMQMHGSVHWSGNAPSPAFTQTYVDTNELGLGDWVPGSPTFVPGEGNVLWQSLFLNGPTSLELYLFPGEFGAQYTFEGPGGVICNIQLLRPPFPTRTPTSTPDPDDLPTSTPTCASEQNRLNLTFGGFDPLDGSAWLVLTNNANRSYLFEGFDLIWPDPTHPDINRSSGAYRLRRVTVGGTSGTDPLGQLVWTSLNDTTDITGNTKNTVPYDVATRSYDASEGTWLTNVVIAPYTTTNIYMDFQGFTGSLSQFGIQGYHFSYTRLLIDCDMTQGGSGGPGGSGDDDGSVDFGLPSPTITRTPAPTKTAGPSKTPVPTVPSNTPIPTNTFAPTPTPTPFTPTFTPSRTPLGYVTPPPSGGSD